MNQHQYQVVALIARLEAAVRLQRQFQCNRACESLCPGRAFLFRLAGK